MAETVRFQFNLADGVPDGDGLTPGKPFTVFPGGLTRAIDGRRVEFGEKEAAATGAAFTEPVPVTLEHEATQRGGEAVGWVEAIHATAGAGLIAAEVRWTSEGVALLSSDRYRYVSGDAFGEWAEDSEGIVFRPRALAAVSLTNKPALRGMGRVRLEAGEPAPGATDPKEETRMKKETFALLGIAENADSDTVHAAFETKLGAVKAEGEAALATAKAEFEAKLAEEKAAGEKATSDAVAAAKAEFEAAAAKEREAVEKAAKVAALVEKGMNEGKVTAATKDAFAALAEGSFEAAEKFLSAALRVAPIAAIFAAPAPEALPDGIDVQTSEGRVALAEKAAKYAAEKNVTFSAALLALVSPAK